MKKSISDLKPISKKVKVREKNKRGVGTEIGLRQKRICLKCGKKFHSKGPYNRICDKCSLMNERVASSTYAVVKSPPADTANLEKRFYGLN